MSHFTQWLVVWLRLCLCSLFLCFASSGRIQGCATEDRCQQWTTKDIDKHKHLFINMGGFRNFCIIEGEKLSQREPWSCNQLSSFLCIEATPNQYSFYSFPMIQTMLRKRQRQKKPHSSTLVTISPLSAWSGMRWRTKTKATEKTPEASIHLKQGIQFEKIILWGFLVKITDPRPSLASGGCHATAWWFPRWDTGSFKNLIKAHISVAVTTRVQEKHWVWISLNFFFPASTHYFATGSEDNSNDQKEALLLKSLHLKKSPWQWINLTGFTSPSWISDNFM